MKKIALILLGFILGVSMVATPVSAYLISSGDTLSSISDEIGMSWQQLWDLNPQIDNPDIIIEGQELSTGILGGSGGIPVTDYETTLTAPLTSSATTISVASVTTVDSTTLTSAIISPAIYLMLEPDNDNKKEIIKCTGISSLTFTGCTRGLSFSGTSETAVSANQKSHSAGVVVVNSNVHYYYVSTGEDQTWSGVNTYNQYPEILSTLGSATTSWQLITLGQANSLANTGGASSTESQIGFSTLATTQENASSTVFGVLDPHVQQSQHSTSTPSANLVTTNDGIWDIWSDNTGKLSQLWLDLTENFAFSGDNTFSGENSFSATTTFKGNVIGATLFGGNGFDGDLNITTGTTTVDLENEAYVVLNYDSISIASSSALTFSNPNATGTIIVLKSKGDVTINGSINAYGMGASAGNNGWGVTTFADGGGDGADGDAGAGGVQTTANLFRLDISGKYIRVTPGAGGGNGGDINTGTPGVGGNGGGAIIIESAGTYKMTGAISVRGLVGTDGITATDYASGSGGGGAGGIIAVIYNSIGDNTGEYDVYGGNGGTNLVNSQNHHSAGGGAGGANRYYGGAGGTGDKGQSSDGADGDGPYPGIGGTVIPTTDPAGAGGGGASGNWYVVENTEF